MKVVIYDAFTHFVTQGINRRWVKGFIDLGHRVFPLPSTEYKINQLEEKVDLLVLMKDVELSELDHLKQFKDEQPDCKVIAIAPKPDSKYLSFLSYVDWWFSISNQHTIMSNFFQERSAVFHPIPEAGDDSLFFPLDIISDSDKLDMAFIGQFGERGHGYRGEDIFLYPLMDAPNISWLGYAFPYKNRMLPSLAYEKNNEVFNMAKINLNFHYKWLKAETDQSVPGPSRITVSPRVYDVALSGNFQLTDHPQAYMDFFGATESEDCTVGFADEETWVEKFHYYLDKPDLRQEMGVQSRQIALKKHTWKNRMELVCAYLNI